VRLQLRVSLVVSIALQVHVGGFLTTTSLAPNLVVDALIFMTYKPAVDIGGVDIGGVDAFPWAVLMSRPVGLTAKRFFILLTTMSS
jgi:hypothetical protein